jgi:hypothetical protein
MTLAVQLALLLTLAVVAVLKVLDRRRPHPDEYDDVRALQRSIEQRAAMRRACRNRHG